jgi:succinyl-diaminopimelate desuccinylase
MEQLLLSWCKRLIGCPSVTGDGTRAIAELCARELLAPHGIETRLIPSQREGDSQVNLVAKVAGTDRDAAAIVFNTHLDTVPPGDRALWVKCAGDPFAAVVEDDRIYGLGAADTKLDFVAKTIALMAVGRPRRDVWLVATFGEEHGLVGAKELVASGILPRGALALVGEPSRLEVITAHKGLMVFELRIGFSRSKEERSSERYQRLTFAGRAAHSSTPALGRNAIKQALETLAARRDMVVRSIIGGDAVNKVPAFCSVVIEGTAVRRPPHVRADSIFDAPNVIVPAAAIAAAARFVSALQDYADSAGPVEPDYASPTLTCNPGIIVSNADSLTLTFELRPPPGLKLDDVRSGLERISQQSAAENHEVTLEIVERRANPGFRGGVDSETVELALKALAAAGLSLNTGVKAGCTEAGIYAAAGLKPVVFGPGPSTSVIHAPNEYNFLSDVEGAVRFYLELLRL